jgi:arsenate reductase-like glutaredoxin family protein
MENAKLEEIKEIVKNLQTHYDFNDYVLNFIDEEELKACEDTSEIIALFEKANEDREITDTEVIYYASAMEYLSENDNSLTESL